MRNPRLGLIAAAGVLVVNLLAVSAPSASAAQRGGNELCVAVSGGTVQNATVLDIAADGGTGIGDASGGSGNLAAAGGNDRERDNGNNNRRNNNRNNRNDWTAESLQALEERLLQTDTASSGNGGVANASGNGGVVSIGDINSGGNAGNAISIGDTHCPGTAPKPSGGGGGGYAAPSDGGGRGGKVSKLPKTGIGVAGVGSSGSLILALGALAMMGLSLGSRSDRRVFRASGR